MAISRESAGRRVRAGPMPRMQLDHGGTTPLYQQISRWFRRAILAGSLRPGQGLPPVAVLARELAISKGPVLGAYELLIAEGYCQRFGSGTCVSPSVSDPILPSDAKALARMVRLEPHADAGRNMSRRAAAMCGPAQAWLQGCHGAGDSDEFPLDIWLQLIARHARKVPPQVMGYGMGYRPLREALAEHLAASHVVTCDPSQILVVTGSQQALQISALALLDPKDGVWLEEPGYPGTRQALHAAGARLVSVPVDAQGLDVECGIRAANRARAAYLSPAHQFPLGVTLSAARRIELLSWAARTGAWIVEDGYDSECRLAAGMPSLHELDTAARVIYVGTLNQVMFPSLRIGFAVIPQDLVQCFLAVRNAIDTAATPVLQQMAMTDFIREGHFSRHVSRMRRVYLERRQALVEAINAEPDGTLEVASTETGSHLTVFLQPGIDDVKVADRAAQLRLRVRDLSRCYAGPLARAGVMLGLAQIPVREASAAVHALRSSIRSLPTRSVAAG
jgi:GntR family transcriptional regulator/MocR family aminotransferase